MFRACSMLSVVQDMKSLEVARYEWELDGMDEVRLGR